MKKKYIVKKNYYIQKIIADKKSYVSKHFILYKKENNLDYFRFVISVGKKIGKAVTRNKIKRQIKAIIYQKKREIIKNYDILIIVRFPVINLKYLDIEKYINEILLKANLIKE
jgi:ribonuclease P protein component